MRKEHPAVAIMNRKADGVLERKLYGQGTSGKVMEGVDRNTGGGEFGDEASALFDIGFGASNIPCDEAQRSNDRSKENDKRWKR